MGSKIRKANNIITKRLADKYPPNTIVNIKMDVFGFSRGAAEARRFISPRNIVTLLYEEFGTALNNYRISINFLGLFDTVLSEYSILSGIELKLQSDIKKVVHLVAANEYREHFPVTSIKEKGKKLRSNYIEIVLPGAHSDIGGGYNQDAVDYLYYFNTNTHVKEWEKWPSTYDLTDENSIKFGSVLKSSCKSIPLST